MKLKQICNGKLRLDIHKSYVTLFKWSTCWQVELDSGLIALAQLRGTTVFKLIPHNPCNSSCPELLGDLHEGEMCEYHQTALSLSTCYHLVTLDIVVMTYFLRLKLWVVLIDELWRRISKREFWNRAWLAKNVSSALSKMPFLCNTHVG